MADRHIRRTAGTSTNELIYDDGRVTGLLLETGEGRVQICEWSSSAAGNGNTKLAIANIRKAGYRFIEAYGVGDLNGDVSEMALYEKYWLHMLITDQVDLIVTDDGI